MHKEKELASSIVENYFKELKKKKNIYIKKNIKKTNNNLCTQE